MATFTYTLPVVGGNENAWGDILNQNWTNLGTFIGSLDSTELAVLDGITATTAELNTLDGITATVTELNYTDGVTSNIQTQLDSKSPIVSPTFTGTVNAGDKIVLGSWEIWDSGGTLYFKYGTNNVFKIDSSGNITAEANVTAYGSV